MNDSLKLQAKDFISIGLYSILIYIVNAVVGIALSPAIFAAMPFISGVCLFFSATVYLLMAIRVGKRWTLFLMAVVTGIIYTLMGVALMLPFFAVAGFIGEIMLLPGNGYQYRQANRQALAYAAYGTLFGMGSFVTVYALGSSYFEKINYSQELIEQIIEFAYSPIWMISGMVFSFILAWLGSILATRILNKHFVKAGYLIQQ
ncbi:MptD family putative ECF transporter S component [Bacillus swezeyi]|uniref:Trep_Strep domain-containing protein n=1 Tax=Bacillus swezeyi TaxID=1925020 RepID=A0A5M8RN97_9BACI|nr:MptD family putative ECF transporter S component [Bacillus swezeyi]KAA6449341.1 Trep_Strep domain-containing protein [Bacillus swezeyi]KAA6474107.1 Trep_Strep domain-containing protein [Bacillus swezeyi]TYS33358.1 MptD family putative ECF transporter S component [Bacillus swezeyi]